MYSRSYGLRILMIIWKILEISGHYAQGLYHTAQCLYVSFDFQNMIEW